MPAPGLLPLEQLSLLLSLNEASIGRIVSLYPLDGLVDGSDLNTEFSDLHPVEQCSAVALQGDLLVDTKPPFILYLIEARWPVTVTSTAVSASVSVPV
jgi:hypothetical protein